MSIFFISAGWCSETRATGHYGKIQSEKSNDWQSTHRTGRIQFDVQHSNGLIKFNKRVCNEIRIFENEMKIF